MIFSHQVKNNIPNTITTFFSSTKKEVIEEFKQSKFKDNPYYAFEADKDLFIIRVLKKGRHYE